MNVGSISNPYVTAPQAQWPVYLLLISFLPLEKATIYFTDLPCQAGASRRALTYREPDPIVKRSAWAGYGLLARIARILILFTVVGSALAGCSRGTPVVVINQSDVPLDDVVLSGSGFSEDIGQVRPNTESRALVWPRGESGLLIRFNARGKAISAGPDGYFEAGGGYIVTVTVSPGLAVSVRTASAY
jgi:hypothetical protein